MTEKRKVRSDKKRDIKPTIDRKLKDTIYRLAFVTNTPVKDVAENICINALQNIKTIDHLSQNFRRTIELDKTIYRGDHNRPSMKKRTAVGTSERITIRFNQRTHDSIATIAYALDTSLSRACALLLEVGILDYDFINDFVWSYIMDNVDAERLKELERILKHINQDKHSPKHLNWFTLISFIIEDARENVVCIKETISDFIIKWNDK